MDTVKVPNAAQMDIAEKSIDNMLDSVDPRVADIVRKKYQSDAQEFAKAAREADPSQGDSSYWAKRSCNKCYGRGIIGQRSVFRPGESARSDGQGGYSNLAFKLPMKCRCGTKKYQRWLAEFRVEYNAQKAQEAEGEGQDDSSSESEG